MSDVKDLFNGCVLGCIGGEGFVQWLHVSLYQRSRICTTAACFAVSEVKDLFNGYMFPCIGGREILHEHLRDKHHNVRKQHGAFRELLVLDTQCVRLKPNCRGDYDLDDPRWEILSTSCGH